MRNSTILVDLFVLFAAAKILGEVFEHVGQPAVVGEILGGILVGPHVLGAVGTESEPVLELLGQLGLIILLFTVGLETSLTELWKVGRSAVRVGFMGVVLPFVAGIALLAGLGYERLQVLFVSAALVATSIGVTGRILRDMGAIRTPVGRVVLGAAVVDDILALIVLAVVSAVAAGDISSLELVVTMLVVFAFLGVVTLAGPRVVRRLSDLAHLPIVPGSPFVLAVLLTFGLAALSETIGLAALIGAFLAGLLFEFRKDELTSQVTPVSELLVPFFFAVVGTRLDPGVFEDPAVLALAVAVTAIAVLTKVAGGFLGSLGLGPRDALTVGVGMVPRGGADLVVASLGLSLGAITPELYGVVVAMTVVTAVSTPPVLGALVKRGQRESAAADDP